MDRIDILLATYNGEKYLKEQLDSLYNQTHKNFEIIARDDGSKDKTLTILHSHNIAVIDSKENLGAKGSFVALLTYAVQNSDSEYLMFCDQDDVWESDKIEQILVKMQEIEKKYPNIPVLVHTDLKIVDEDLQIINKSFMSYQDIDATYNDLNNLILQNTITGCTVMINRKLAKLCLPIPTECMMHDWWIGLVASYFGEIGYLNAKTIQYRQHADNSIGAKGFSYINILKKGFNHSHQIIIKGNIVQAQAFLNRYKTKLDKDTIKMLEDFIAIEEKSFWQKRKILIRHKLLKQGFIRNLGLFLKI